MTDDIMVTWLTLENLIMPPNLPLPSSLPNCAKLDSIWKGRTEVMEIGKAISAPPKTMHLKTPGTNRVKK